ncbi:MAG: peptidoglycan-binding protein [Patescibacteria group bacterium]|nr:peptidoglycan-binding protein [Patescibacteria group bacterium]MCL5224253.1 peptidoglycan-binding protein [Patescibacteria group bacterium]
MTRLPINKKVFVIIAVAVIATSGLVAVDLTHSPRAMAATCNPNSLQPVQYGEQDSAVADAQACLIQLNYSIPAGATGYYGDQTVNAVIQFYKSWYGTWNGQNIGPLGVQQLKNDVAAQSTQQQTSSSTPNNTTTQTTCTAPGSGTLTVQAGQSFTINWCAVNVNYCEVGGPNLNTTNCFAGSSPNQFNSSPITLNAPGQYTYTIVATGPPGQQTSVCTNSTITGITSPPKSVTVTVTAAPPQQQTTGGNTQQNLGGGANCSPSTLLPCFNEWNLQAINPPLPTCSFTANPSSVTSHQPFSLNWSCNNITTSCIDPLSGQSRSGSSGSDQVSGGITQTTPYELICQDSQGDLGVATTTVTLFNPYIKEVNP